MKELFFIMASVIPFDELLTHLEESISKYRNDPSDDSRKELTMNCMLVSASDASEGKKIEEVLSQLAKQDAAMKLLNHDLR